MDGEQSERRSFERPYQVRQLPPDFAERFVSEGWRGIEVAYGARTSVNKRWVIEAGGEDLKRRRMEYRMAQRKPEGRPARIEPAPAPAVDISVRRAIDFLRSARGGAWPISATGAGDFFFGAARMTGDELIAKAVRKGLDLRPLGVRSSPPFPDR